MEKPSEKEDMIKVLAGLLKERYANKSGIIYTFSIKDAEELASELARKGDC